MCWLALRERDLDSVLGELNFRRTGRQGIPAEHPVVARQDDRGWIFVVASDWEDPIVAPASLARLSRNSDVLACQMDAPLLSCSVSAWRHGERHWWIEHDANRGLEHLDVGGEIPEMAEAWMVRDGAATAAGNREEPARRVPLCMAAAIVGLGDDVLPGRGGAAAFEALVAADDGMPASLVRPWWRVW